MPPDNPIIVALDLPGREALALASLLRGRVRWVKVGMTLFYAEGPVVVSELKNLGFEVFLDLKLNDIPHQVAGAAAAIARLGVGMFTVHASGGVAMMRSAVDSASRAAEEVGLAPPAVLAVTVLTSTDDEGLNQIGIEATAADQVVRLARLAEEAGADGVVCSPAEAARISSIVDSKALIVTPGVRPTWAEAGDQARISTPLVALEAGATHLVIGRPITAAADPATAIDRILSEIERIDR
ncbi:MAG: orotidine-5'-phosphate decarboxylase [Coriobacteriia bacterium]